MGREKGWYVADIDTSRLDGNAVKRGPYKHQETADAVRTELERFLPAAVGCWNLAVVSEKWCDEYDRKCESGPESVEGRYLRHSETHGFLYRYTCSLCKEDFDCTAYELSVPVICERCFHNCPPAEVAKGEP